jgi:hypothetical protein
MNVAVLQRKQGGQRVKLTTHNHLVPQVEPYLYYPHMPSRGGQGQLHLPSLTSLVTKQRLLQCLVLDLTHVVTSDSSSSDGGMFSVRQRLQCKGPVKFT